MKRVLIFLFFAFFPFQVNAQEKEKVTFKDCVDGDTAKVILNQEEIKIRFLAIDTPETKHPTEGEEAFGKEASAYTCNALQTAKIIEIEYDDGSDQLDKYDRHLVWVFVDGSLLQKELIAKGYAEVAYLYGDYKYTSLLEEEQKIAKENKVGIWSDEEPSSSHYEIYILIVLLVIFILFLVFDKKYRKQTLNKIKKKTKNKFKKEICNLLK